MTDLRITSPLAGSTVGPLEPILGDGATSAADVDLVWNDTVISTVEAGADGTFAFEGDTPMALGEVTLTVTCEGDTSEPVTFTVVEEEPGPPEPAEGSGYMPPDPPTVYEDAAKPTEPPGSTATGAPPAERLPTTNAYEGGGLPMSPREPDPVGNPPPGRTHAQINSGRR